MDTPHPLPDALVELIAQRFRVLGEPMRIRLLDALRDGDGDGRRADGGARRLAAERLQAPRRAAPGRDRRPHEAGHLRALRDRRRGVFELCDQVCGGPSPADHRARRDPHGGTRDDLATSRPSATRHAAGRWSACCSRMAGTVTLLSALLAAVVSPWFLLLTAFVGVNQWLYVLVGACPRVARAQRRLRPALDPLPARRPPDEPVRTDRPARPLHRHALPRRSRSAGRSSPSCSASSRRRSSTRSPGAGWEATGSESVAARKAIDRNFQGLSSSALMVVVHSDRQDRRATRRSSGRSRLRSRL